MYSQKCTLCQSNNYVFELKDGFICWNCENPNREFYQEYLCEWYEPELCEGQSCPELENEKEN